MKTLFVTNVGSHMWGQNHPGSDLDRFVCYIVPSRDVLTGRADTKSKHLKNEKQDDAVHEIGHVIDEVLKGNVNFLWGVFSPIVMEDPRGDLAALRDLALQQMSQLCYNSIHGMAISNYKKFIASGLNTSMKKCNTIARTIGLGITLLQTGKIEFKPVWDATSESVQRLIVELDNAKTQSILPEKPDHPETLYEFLLQLRLRDLKEAST